MYKRLLIALSAALALGLSVGAAACGTADLGGESGEDMQPVPAVWQFDEEGHWLTASDEKLWHADEDGDGFCDVCGYRLEPAALEGEEEEDGYDSVQEDEKGGADDDISEGVSDGDWDEETEETAPVWKRASGKLAAYGVAYEFEYAPTEDGLALRVRADGGECEVLSVRAADGDREDLYFAEISSATGEQILFLDLGGEFFFEEVRSADLTGYEGTLLYYADGERGVFVYACTRAGTVSEVSGAKGGFSHRQGNVGVYWVSLPYETGTLYFALTETEEDVMHAAAAECRKAVLTTEDGEYGLEYLVEGGRARAIIALNGRDGQPAFRGDIQWASDGLAFRYLNGEQALCVVHLAQTLTVYEGDRAILTLSDLGVQTVSFEGKGALVRLPVPEGTEGYVFGGWFYYTVDESFNVVYGERAGEELVADGDVNLIAVYYGKTYAVNVQTGGAQESIEISPAVAGTNIQLPVPSREGFLFLGWKVRDGDGNEVECAEEQGVYRFQMPPMSVTAEACWANAAYGTDGGEAVTVGYLLSEDGEIVIVAIVSGGVVRTQGISGGRLFSFYTASEDQSAPVVFAYAALGEAEEAQAYLLLFSKSVLVLPASFVTAEDGAYGTLVLIGEAQDFPVLVRVFETEGGSAVGGTVTETERIGETTVYAYEGEEGRFFVLLSGDGRQTAVYASAVRITYSTDGGSADLFPYGFVEAGGTLTLPSSPEREGYSFAGWRLTDGEGNVYGLYAAGDRVSGLSCDLFATAVWEEIVYTVAFVNGEEERTLAVRYAETLESAGFSEIEPPSKPYFVFDGWYCGETAASGSFVPYGDTVFTARFTQTEAIPSEVQSPSEAQPIEYGTADNMLLMTNLTPAWVGKIKAGERVSFTGTLTSAADYARYSPYLYLFTGVAPDYYIRADGYVYGQLGDSASSATVNGGNLTVTKTSAAAIDEITFCSVIAEAAITVTFDWSDLSVIRISIVLDGVFGGEILREFTVTPAAGQTLAEEYSIGFGGDHCHVVFTSRIAS